MEVRKLKASYTLDLANDLSAMHGIDIQKELAKAIEHEFRIIRAEKIRKNLELI
jgi:hypothetical protein